MLSTKLLYVSTIFSGKMRDPERIQELLDLLKELWLRDPDLRFNQHIYNLQSEYSYMNSDIGQIKEVASDGFERIGFDLFNLEDNDFSKFLRTKI